MEQHSLALAADSCQCPVARQWHAASGTQIAAEVGLPASAPLCSYLLVSLDSYYYIVRRITVVTLDLLSASVDLGRGRSEPS